MYPLRISYAELFSFIFIHYAELSVYKVFCMVVEMRNMPSAENFQYSFGWMTMSTAYSHDIWPESCSTLHFSHVNMFNLRSSFLHIKAASLRRYSQKLDHSRKMECGSCHCHGNSKAPTFGDVTNKYGHWNVLILVQSYFQYKSR